MMYRIDPAWSATVAEMEEALEPARFVECGASQEKAIGWTEPRGKANGPLVEAIAGQRMLKLMMEMKAVPGTVLTRKAKERAAQIEATTGRKPGKKETREIKEELKLSLLPMAFTKQAAVEVWIDPDARLLVLDVGSQSRADEVVTMLVKSLTGFSVTLINTAVSPAVAMAQWLTTQEPPPGFTVDRECELKATDESKSVVRYSRHALDIDEVRLHIDGGKAPTRVAMTWDDRVSFVLTDGLVVKKVAFLDVVFEGAKEGKDDGFDADVVIATAELQKMLPDLLEALRQLRPTELHQTLAQLGDQPTAGEHAVIVGGNTRVGEQVGVAKGFAKGFPLAIAHHRQEDLLVVLDAEHVIDAPGRDALGHGCGGLAGHGELQHVLGHQKDIVLEQRALHLLAPSGLRALRQRRHGANGTKHAAHDVVDAGAGPQRVARPACHVGQAAHHLHHLVQRGAMVVGARQKALVADVDQALVEFAQRGIVQPQLFHGLRLEVLADDVGGGDQLEHHLAAPGAFHVNGQAFLVAVEQGKETGASAQ